MEKTKADNMLNFLGEVIRKSVLVPKDLELLTRAVRTLAEDVKSITSSVQMMLLTLQQHQEHIADLYALNDRIIEQLKISSAGRSNQTQKKQQKPN